MLACDDLDDFTYKSRDVPGKVKRPKKKEHREIHNQNERIRRDALSDLYTKLQSNLPSLSGKEPQSRLKLVEEASKCMIYISEESRRKTKLELDLRTKYLIIYQKKLDDSDKGLPVNPEHLALYAKTLAVPATLDGMENCGCEELIQEYKAKLEEMGLGDFDRRVCPAMYEE